VREQYILAVDVEATCDIGGIIPRNEMEIIEIGAVLLNSKLEALGEFQTFIKPHVHPVLSDFCTELTTITQKDVDNAPAASEAFHALSEWLKGYKPIQWCSWGNYDNNQFKKDCARSGIPWPLPERHFNAKQKYAEWHGKKVGLGLGKAINRERLKWIGSHHRALDDAKNVVQILRKILISSNNSVSDGTLFNHRQKERERMKNEFHQRPKEHAEKMLENAKKRPRPRFVSLDGSNNEQD